jgi:hypothetical protein
MGFHGEYTRVVSALLCTAFIMESKYPRVIFDILVNDVTDIQIIFS